MNNVRLIPNSEQGFVALMSAIVISALLLAITVALGFSGFLGRLDIVDSESKERSSALAEACANQAILDVATNTLPASYPSQVSVGSDHCFINAIMSHSPSTDQTTIQAQACVNKAYTNMNVVIDSNSFSVASWQELPNFSPNIFCN